MIRARKGPAKHKGDGDVDVDCDCDCDCDCDGVFQAIIMTIITTTPSA